MVSGERALETLVNDVTTPKSAVCRICRSAELSVVVDLGMSPLANAYPSMDLPDAPETFYPLRVYVCKRCFLVQVNDVTTPDEIFSDYAYFSSFSETWLRQCQDFARNVIARLSLTPQSRVIEIASNDGYMLQYFKHAGLPVLGVEPAANVAAVARQKGIETEVSFFGRETAKKVAQSFGTADLLIANNVIAHVPDLHDFVAGMASLLSRGGVATVEFQHLLNVVGRRQFDTIYHEHYCYHSLTTIEQLFAQHGLRIFDVEELSSHGGSLRLYLDDGGREPLPSVQAMRERERLAGLFNLSTYDEYAVQVEECKRAFLRFFLDANAEGKTVVGYGAPAKGNTFLNYCGLKPDLLPFTVDKNPHKQGHFLPGLRIPILSPNCIADKKPDYVLILAWNLRDEIADQMKHIRDWGGRFVVAIPQLEII